MPQNSEAQAFLARIAALPAGPGVSLDDVLKPSIEDEAELRRYFASDRGNTRLSDPYVGLVDVFDAPADIRQTRARVVVDEVDLSAKHVMPLKAADRRPEGAPAMVSDIDEFKKNWTVFTEGSLSQLKDWSNVVAAGGSVLACLTPLSDKNKESKRAIRKHYHNAAYPTSDVDLFLWGLTPEQAEVKINAIYEAVRDSVPWDVTCIRTKHTVSIHSQYPYRSVQIVLRLYHSPAEVLAGFDIDAPCFAYDGSKVWGNPRAIVAMMRQCNTVDMTRRSPSYEVRLAKYASRGYEVYVPDLVRDKIDPTIYERSIVKMEGLARLLVFEKLKDGDARYSFLESRRQLRGRPNPLTRYHRNKRKYKGDLKGENAIGGLEMNDYDVASLHIPYGPGWDARRIDKLVYQTDLGMNSTFNPKNKGRRLHRHPAFFGTMKECLEDCCENCPEPIDDDEKELQAKESEMYITGRIKFIEENPGRQSMTGSFNPIDVGEWSEQVYVRQAEQFFAAIAANDIEAVKTHLKSEGIDLNNRDHVGRTALHVAIISGATQAALELVDAGARISARMADGRNALHLAARFDQLDVVKKLLERNALNKEQVGKEDDDDTMDEDKKEVDPVRPSSEDDWSSDENDGKDVEMADADDEDEDEDADDEDGEDGEGSDDGSDTGESKPDGPPASAAGDLPEDDEDEPDVFEIDVTDWDFGFSPLSYAILFASPAMIDLLVEAGADLNQATTANHHGAEQLHPLTLTILRDDEDEACAIAERLLKRGATSSTADNNLFTIFHKIVAAKKTKLVATILKGDKNSSSVIDFPAVRYSSVFFPIVTAIWKKDYSTLAVLLAHGAKVTLEEEDVSRARDAADPRIRANLFYYGVTNYLDNCHSPLETALVNHDDIIQLLLSWGSNPNLPIKGAVRNYASAGDRLTLGDWVEFAIQHINTQIDALDTVVVPKNPEKQDSVSAGGVQKLIEDVGEARRFMRAGDQSKEKGQKEYEQAQKLQLLNGTKDYLLDVQRLFQARSAKTWKELFPDIECLPWSVPGAPGVAVFGETLTTNVVKYRYISNSWRASAVPSHLNDAYDELYEACFTGDNAKIEELCVPPKDGNVDPKKPLLNINVQFKSGDEENYQKSGLTPLWAACEGRRWSTAKLIVAIAAAQYTPEDKKEEKVHFSISRVALEDDDSDYDSDDSDAHSDYTVQGDEVKFVDIAKASGSVKSDIHPKYMISQAIVHFWQKPAKRGEERKVSSSNLLGKAALMNDREAFCKIADLYHSLSEPVDLEYGKILEKILAADDPDILHEYIRRTGHGLDFEQAKKATEHLPQIINDSNRVYLGLNVHGKKRADLARKNDPNAVGNDSESPPLVWLAAKHGAVKIIEYLAGERPLAAFRHHATAGNTPRAEQLRRVPDLEKALPSWLGWVIDHVGESPLTAAIMGNSIEAVKTLFAKKPQFMKTTLHEKLNFIGYNAIMLAISRGCKTEILDFLLAKSISPVERDLPRGWNVFHFAALKGNRPEILEYLIKKLPRDVSEVLINQRSKTRLNTPLHVAAKMGHYKALDILLNFDDNLALVRNVDGQTALHIAVETGRAKSTERLLKATQYGGLFMENGIGHTPYETLYLKHLASSLQTQRNQTSFSISTVSVRRASPGPQRVDIDSLEKEIPRLKETVASIIAEDRPANSQKFAFDFEVFIKTLESLLASAKEAKAKLPPAPAAKEKEAVFSEDLDISKTWQVVQQTVISIPKQQRDLIKLFDVQQSVKANLDKVAPAGRKKDAYSDDEDEGAESKTGHTLLELTTYDTGPDFV
ncbi:ankyrin repeat protein [Coprinopsis cinerea okayama7|uniref:Ankyrin repeat protein n=1 Tax=Coprinopsis cinerea (strain Okayama-7 / 130 / ATCC MYA-4618 / FGSC 9003) TaxID=240176 RepID=A8P7N9_COPC7|nr:ankyrin repeat protein [Coprinopsis cinerea okayama7\|eukprot:XP_001839400.1 ankyrin repeat protein [Coprinopsis cinerea okayama7\